MIPHDVQHTLAILAQRQQEMNDTMRVPTARLTLLIPGKLAMICSGDTEAASPGAIARDFDQTIRRLIPHRRWRDTLGQPTPFAGTDGQGQVPRGANRVPPGISGDRFKAPGAEAAWKSVAAAASKRR